MANSLLSNKTISIVLVGVLSIQLSAPVFSETPRPFPVLGSITVQQGNWSDMPDLLGKLVDKVPEDTIRFQITSSQAEQYFSLGLMDESRKAFQKLLKAKKPSPSLFTQDMSNLRLAEISLLEDKADDALQLLAPDLSDSNPYIAQEALFLEARCFLVKKDWLKLNQAVDDLIHRDSAYSTDLAVNLLRGVSALEQDRPDEALLYVKKYPDEPSALYYETVSYIKKKEVSNALPLYQQMLLKNPDSEWVDRMRMALGEAFYETQDIALAQEFFKPVTRPDADPELRPLALHRRGCLFFEQKNFAEADKIFTSLLKEYPKHPLRTQWTYLYASIPIFAKDWKKAIQAQKMGLEFTRGLAPRAHGVDEHQLRLSAEFRILWAHLLLNNFNGAKILSDKFIAHYPNEPMTAYAYLAKGLALYRMGEYDHALEVYQDLLNKFPDSSATGKAVYLMTLALHSARDPFRMAGILNEVHNRMSKAPEGKSVDEWTQNTVYWVGDAYYQLNDLQSAEKIYKEFIARTPQSPLIPYALESLAATLSAQGPSRDGEALVALHEAELRAHDLGNNDLEEQMEIELGKIYYNQRDFAQAAAKWDHLVLVSTQPVVRAEAMFRAGDALSRQEFYQEAIKRWKTLAQTYRGSPWVPEALMRTGNTLSGLGRWAEAASTFATIKQSYAGSDVAKEADFQLIQCAFNQGNMMAAIDELLSFAKQYSDDARIAKTADNLLSSFHQNKIAVPAAKEAQLLKLAPGSAGGAALLWEKGASLFNEGKYESAQKLFEKVMLSYPNDEYAPLAYYYNADCFFWMQKWDDAATAYQTFFISYPKHERVPNAMFQKALSLFRKGSYDDAIANFKNFLHRFPDHPLAKDAWLDIALAHKKAFHLDDAVAAYKYILQHYSGDPKVNTVWLQMGALLEVQGKQADARQAYASIAAGSAEYPEALYREALLAEQQKHIPEAEAFLEKLRAIPDRKNEFRVAALIKLSEFYEGEGAAVPKLRALYEDLQASTADPEVAKQAGLRLKDLQ